MQKDIRLTAKIETYLVCSGAHALCYIGARNSTKARMDAYHDARHRGVELQCRDDTSPLGRLDDFSPLRARAVDGPLDLDEGEVIALDDAESRARWFPTLSKYRLAAGSVDRPVFRHRPTPCATL